MSLENFSLSAIGKHTCFLVSRCCICISFFKSKEVSIYSSNVSEPGPDCELRFFCDFGPLDPVPDCDFSESWNRIAILK